MFFGMFEILGGCRALVSQFVQGDEFVFSKDFVPMVIQFFPGIAFDEFLDDGIVGFSFISEFREGFFGLLIY